VTLVSIEPSEFKRMIRQRRRFGGDRYDFQSEVLGLGFRLVQGTSRPQIEVSRGAPQETWLV
jgi:hypothetical protein